jgi:Uncharacterized protein conserved in bacteria (DUF2252)
MSSILRATRDYEEWLGTQLRLLPADIGLKHEAMREGRFAFFRGSFFRWAREWKQWCPEVADAPRVIAVGDPHVENFGTWRDAEGRLIWGVNDFDDAWRLPYTSDLVRLSASAILARRERALSSAEGSLLDAILHGYSACLEAGGQPFVLAERHVPLRAMALARLRDASTYWRKIEASPDLPRPVPRRTLRTVRRSLPAGTVEVRWVHRLAGIGSLGRERITAIGSWRGAKVAREAKALAPSACMWAEGRSSPRRRWHRLLLSHPLRCPDPFAQIRGRWIIRRLAPDCARIALDGLRKATDEQHLLRAMGWEVANVHLASRNGHEIPKDLCRRVPRWLQDATDAVLDAVERDYKIWRDG